MSDIKKLEARTLKGFRDFDPEDERVRQEIFRTIAGVFEVFGFQQISTPALEYKELLMNKYGDDEKLVYSFTDNGDREVAMRYDLTVPLARYVAERQGKIVLPFKRFQIQPVWRAENTQRGRFREFYQCDIDVVGTSSGVADAEVIAGVSTALEKLGVNDYEVRVNDRELYRMFAKTYNGPEDQIKTIIRGVDKLEKIGDEGVISWLADQGIAEPGLSQVRDFLTIKDAQNVVTEIQNRFEGGADLARKINTLFKRVMRAGISADKLTFDPYIARGLDYYTGTVFEIVLKGNPEFGSVAGGGRYDNLLDQFSTTSVPAVGGSIGVDRLIEALTARNGLPKRKVKTVCVFTMSEDLATEEVVALVVKQLRAEGIPTDVYPEAAKLEKQFKYAEARGYGYAILVGEEEVKQNVVKLKNLETREEQVVSREAAADILRA